MRNISDSDCDCLPDCELMDLQYSVSANKFMWVWLCNFVHFSTFFYGDQRVKKFSKFRINFFRPCDSRNLNLSPLCTFEAGTLPKYWFQEVKMPRKNQRNFVPLQVVETYSNTPDPTPSYVSSLSSPMRKKHKDSLIITKSEVRVESELTAGEDL